MACIFDNIGVPGRFKEVPTPNEPVDLVQQMWACSLLLSFSSSSEWWDESRQTRLWAAHDVLCGGLKNHIVRSDDAVLVAQNAHDLITLAMSQRETIDGQIKRLSLVIDAQRVLAEFLFVRVWPIEERGNIAKSASAG